MAAPRAENAFVGTATAAEMLGMKPENAPETLERYGVRSQRVRLKTRLVPLYERSEVERVQKLRVSDERRREADEKRRIAARRNLAAKAIAATWGSEAEAQPLAETAYCSYGDHMLPKTSEFWYRNTKTGGLHLTRCRSCESERRRGKKAA